VHPCGIRAEVFQGGVDGNGVRCPLQQALSAGSVEVKTSSFVHKISGHKEVTFVCPKERSWFLRITSSSHGCRERTREMLTIPGTRPTGIFNGRPRSGNGQHPWHRSGKNVWSSGPVTLA